MAVIGGGLAGISAALACVDAGAEVTLLEASPRLGGAACSFRRGELWVDNGQHVFLRCCSAYRGLLERLGTTGATMLQPRLDIPVLMPGRRSLRLRRSGLPAPLHLGGALLRYRALAPAERLSAARCALRLRRLDPGDGALDRRSFGSWLAEQRQSARARAALWDLIALPTLNLHADDASLALAVKVFRTGLLDRTDAGDIGYATRPLAEVHAEPARRALATAGADVRDRTRVLALESGERGVTVRTDAGTVEADAAVVAVAHHQLPAIAGPRWPDVAALGVSPIVNLHVVYDRRVTRHAFAAVLDSPLQFVFDRTAAAGLRRGQYLAVSLSAADGYAQARSAELRAAFLPEIRRVFPGAARVEPIDAFVTREKEATFRAAPGSAAVRPGCRISTPRVYLAGAWTDTGWPATMEGAVRSGITAARAALIDLGHTRSLPEEVAA